jgi:hypothetical protein
MYISCTILQVTRPVFLNVPYFSLSLGAQDAKRESKAPPAMADEVFKNNRLSIELFV